MKKYRFFAAFLAAVLFVSLLTPAYAAQPPELLCGAAILVDGDHNEVLFEKNAHQRMYPASITKIMTSLLVMEAIDRGDLALDTPITATASAIASITDPDSSTQNIQPGEVLTVEELLYCDLVASANEACSILAETVGGTLASFVGMMNQRAAELGMENTHFANPHGLHDPEHYTTAYDVYLMAREAMSHEIFRTIVSTPSYVIPATEMSPERTLNSTNLLINSRRIPGYIYSKAIGIKTGSTSAAGQCLASAAVDSDGRTFYCVVLNAQNVTEEDGSITRRSFKESAELLEWGFSNFKRVVLMDEASGLQEVPVTLSDEQDHVLVQPQGRVERTLPTDYDPEKAELIPDLPESVEAPVTAGQKLGTVTLFYEGEAYGTLDLVAVSDVARSDMQYFWKMVQEYLDTWWVRVILIAVVLLVLFLLFFCWFIVPRRRARRRRGYSTGRRSYHYSGNRRRRRY